MSLLHFFKNILTKHRFKELAGNMVFDHYFFDLKYYLHTDASTEEFSHLLNMSHEKLDRISNEIYGSTFQLLLNEYRFKHFMEELESPINANLSINSIIKFSGFESDQQLVEFVKKRSNCMVR
jgi:AraC-like DNA-binding protein